MAAPPLPPLHAAAAQPPPPALPPAQPPQPPALPPQPSSPSPSSPTKRESPLSLRHSQRKSTWKERDASPLRASPSRHTAGYHVSPSSQRHSMQASPSFRRAGRPIERGLSNPVSSPVSSPGPSRLDATLAQQPSEPADRQDHTMRSNEERLAAFAEQIKAEVIARRGAALRSRNAAQVLPSEHNLLRAVTEADAELHRRLQPSALRKEMARRELALQLAQLERPRDEFAEGPDQPPSGLAAPWVPSSANASCGSGNSGVACCVAASPSAHEQRMERMAKWERRLSKMHREHAASESGPPPVSLADVEAGVAPESAANAQRSDSDDSDAHCGHLDPSARPAWMRTGRAPLPVEALGDAAGMSKRQRRKQRHEARLGRGGLPGVIGEALPALHPDSASGRDGDGATSGNPLPPGDPGAGHAPAASFEPQDLFEMLLDPPDEYPAPLADGESAIKYAFADPSRRATEVAVIAALSRRTAAAQPSENQSAPGASLAALLRRGDGLGRLQSAESPTVAAELGPSEGEAAPRAIAEADAPSWAVGSAAPGQAATRENGALSRCASSMDASGTGGQSGTLSARRADGRDRAFANTRVNLGSSVLTHAQAATMAHRGTDPRPRLPTRAKARYTRPQDGDIGAQYAPTVEPEKMLAEARQRKAEDAAAGIAVPPSHRAPFAEAFERRKKAEGNMTFFAPVWPAFDDCWPSLHEMPQPFLALSFPPEELLPTGTDMDDFPNERVARLLAEVCKLVFEEPNPSERAESANTDGGLHLRRGLAGLHVGSTATTIEATPPFASNGDGPSADATERRVRSDREVGPKSGVHMSEEYVTSPPAAVGHELLVRQIMSHRFDLGQRLPLVPVGIDTSHDRVLRRGRQRGAGKAASATVVARIEKSLGLSGEPSSPPKLLRRRSTRNALAGVQSEADDMRATHAKGLASEHQGVPEAYSDSDSISSTVMSEWDGDRPSSAGSVASNASARSLRSRREGETKRKARLQRRQSQQELREQARLLKEQEELQATPQPLPAATRERMQRVFDALQSPLEDQIAFAAKYTHVHNIARIDEALGWYEAAIVKLKEWRQHKMAMRLATARSVGLECYHLAMEIKEVLDDQPSFRGTPFTELFAHYVPEVEHERERQERLKEVASRCKPFSMSTSARPEIV